MPSITFGSVCSGIEAASVAWGPLGWEAAWFSEIEKFPSELLRLRYPDVPNLGCMTTIAKSIRQGKVIAPDILCGGTPCQSFSFAGARKSLDDERGSLTLTFCEIADAIDSIRRKEKKPPCIIFWENVPGVLNTADNAFGCFLAEIAGEVLPLKPSGERWTDAGAVLGPKRAVAWRVLDAQYFGLAQRRKRVFVVASAREDICPAQVLFEPEVMQRRVAPSRGKENYPSKTTKGGAYPAGSCGEIVGALCAGDEKGVGNQYTKQNKIVIALAGQILGRGPGNGGNGKGFDNSGVCYTLTTADKHGVVYDKVARRLTPIEHERLQGFPDNYTRIPWRGATEEDCPDGPRYIAIGNSWAVPVIEWAGRRIEKQYYQYAIIKGRRVLAKYATLEQANRQVQDKYLGCYIANLHGKPQRLYKLNAAKPRNKWQKLKA